MYRYISEKIEYGCHSDFDLAFLEFQAIESNKDQTTTSENAAY